MNLLELFKKTKINVGCATIERDSAEMLEYEFQITPKTFLNFSKQDFKTKDQRGNTNALTNAKRAIDCQTDKILRCFGFPIDKPFPPATNKYIQAINPDLSKTDIQYKLKLLQVLDLAPASIIANTRTIRNKLEHYYESFSDNDVENAIQLADLFINATDSKLKMVWSYRIEDTNSTDKKNDSCIDVSFDEKEFTIKVRGFKNGAHTKIDYTLKDIEFYPLLKLTYSFHYPQDLEDYFRELMQIIEHPIPVANIHLDNI